MAASQARASRNPSAPAKAPIHCVVTVHGMGEPKFNSTLMPVAEQIVQAAYPKLAGDTLTLGGLCGLTGFGDPGDKLSIPCFALQGICAEGNPDAVVPALLQPARRGGNLFFADIFWSDITQEAFPKAGDSLTHWTECLLNRVERKRLDHDRGEGNWWVMDMLYLLRRTLVFAEKALAWRSKELTDMVFGKYLGDVQVYGEFAQCRGKAVRIFHESMARIHAYLDPDGDQPVEFTVIAHSLGTVLSLDALTLAHYGKYRNGPGGSGGKGGDPALAPDFPGYEDGGGIPDLEWIESVRAFVTLGSPIDKFLTLWWFNYLHLAGTDWIQPRRSGRRIKHYNFCDEQDPVGHRLDFARSAPAFAAIFTGEDDPAAQWNDVVYNHTPLPGWAHVSYWKDKDLFKLILKRVIVGKDGAPQDLTPEDWKEFQVYRRGVYTWILMIHFYLVPILCIGACNFALTLALLSESWHARGLGVLAFLLTAWYGRTALMLNIGWRRALKNDSLNSPDMLPKAGKKAPRKSAFLYDREKHSRNARNSWKALAGGAWVGSLAFSAVLWKDHTWLDLLKSDGMPVTLASTVVLTVILFILSRLGRTRDAEALIPASLKRDIAWGRKRELAVVGFALLPPLLMSVPALAQPVLWAVSALRGLIGLGGWRPQREYLVFLGVLFQLSALGWMEMIWIHRWMKRRFTAGRKDASEMPLWQKRFKVYAGAGGAPEAGLIDSGAPAGTKTKVGV